MSPAIAKCCWRQNQPWLGTTAVETAHLSPSVQSTFGLELWREAKPQMETKQDSVKVHLELQRRKNEDGGKTKAEKQRSRVYFQKDISDTSIKQSNS